MEVTFGEAEHAALFSSEHQMVRRWGRDGFEYVGRRLFELAGATNLDHVAALPGTEVSRDGANRVTITFDRGDLIISAELVGDPGTQGANTMMGQAGLHLIGLDVHPRVGAR